MQAIIFTDLDGCLLDRQTYEHTAAKPALEAIYQKQIPLIFVSAKTYSEMTWHQREIGINQPFIAENGSAIFVPQSYFDFEYPYSKKKENFCVIELGKPIEQIYSFLDKARKNYDFDLKGYHEMTSTEVSKLTGLAIDAAERAMLREYDETIKANLSDDDLKLFLEQTEKAKLQCLHGGSFLHLLSASGKGTAIKKLSQLFEKQYQKIETLGLGDSQNDISLLETVDIPFLIRRPDDSWLETEIPGLTKSNKIGPAGWSEVLLSYFSNDSNKQ